MRNSAVIIMAVFIAFMPFQRGTGRSFAQEKGVEQKQPVRQPPPQPHDGKAQEQDAKAQPQDGKAQQQPQTGHNEAKNKKNPAAAAVPVLEIKKLESEKPLYSIELRNVELADLFRVIAHDYNLNIMVDKDVSGTITASFTSISLEEALDAIAELSNLVIQKKGNIFRVSLNLITKTITFKYIEAKKMLQGSSAQPGAAGTAAAPAAGTGAAGQGTTSQESTIYDLLSGQGKVLLGDQPNSIMVIDYPKNVKSIEDYVGVIDQKMTSRVFQLKYLKATDVVGQPAPAAASGTAPASTSGTTATTSGTTVTTSGSAGGG